jgi:hypothetical protein
MLLKELTKVFDIRGKENAEKRKTACEKFTQSTIKHLFMVIQKEN